jgi:hypothetical protein
MPAPNGSAGYTWLYNFLHTVAGNLSTVVGSKIPGVKPLLLALLLILPVMTVSACHGYAVHPGSLNQVDSAAFDTLLVAEAAIDQARIEYNAGTLPASSKTPLDALVKAYNVARESWLTYRGAISTSQPTQIYLDQLTKNLNDLTAAVKALQGGQ